MNVTIRTMIVVTLIALFAFSIVNAPSVYADTELTASEKGTKFLSNVVGLDLSKYNLTQPPSDASSYPSQLCGLVKEECRNYQFEASESKISVMSVFYNGQLKNIKVTSLIGDYIYSEPPAADLLTQTKILLQRYQIYVAQVDSTDSSYLTLMQDILNNISDLSPTNITVGDINFQVSVNNEKTRIQWIYTKNGFTMDYKRVDLSFQNGTFLSFRDIWRVYSVSGFSVINSEEAYNLALDTAQTCEFRIVNDEMNEVVTLSDLSNSSYDMYFTMIPYRNETAHMTSQLNRDPLTLYPYWQFYFYFNGEEIGGYSGVQVGIWGDTKEIVYCSGFGFLGTSGTSYDDNITSEDQMGISEQPENSEQTNLLSNSLFVTILIIAVLAMLVSVIILRTRSHQKL